MEATKSQLISISNSAIKDHVFALVETFQYSVSLCTLVQKYPIAWRADGLNCLRFKTGQNGHHFANNYCEYLSLIYV